MRHFLALFTFLLISTIIFAQGTNNDFSLDDEDLKYVFKELGFESYKFPIQQSASVLYDIIVEEFKDGKLLNSSSTIEGMKDTFKDFGLDATTYFRPSTDSTFFHRFYIHSNDTLLKLMVKSHGASYPYKFALTDVSNHSSRALFSTKEEIDSLGYLRISEPKNIMFIYANSLDEKDKPLWCPAGLPKEKLIQQFYYVIYITIQEYKSKDS
jgi:hypothetical protein